MSQLNFSFGDESDPAERRPADSKGDETGGQEGETGGLEQTRELGATDADGAARLAIATDLETSLLVEAAAGTGKTQCLVDRIVNLLSSGRCQASELVVVTFTRKAAAELQERVQTRLRLASEDRKLNEKQRSLVQAALRDIGLAFIGTIHSFAASVLRERPIEFQVAPDFRELEEGEDSRLRSQAWTQTLLRLKSEDQQVLKSLEQLGVAVGSLRGCFERFIEYRDIDSWPSDCDEPFDEAALRAAVETYVAEMRQLVRSFPEERGNDKLMAQYETIVRGAARDLDKPRAFWRFLTYFDRSANAVQKMWSDPKLGKAQKGRFEAFREEHVRPAFRWLRQERYSHTIAIVREAVETHRRLKLAAGGLDFTDLLQLVVEGLRVQPALRSYFQNRFRCILVDEFQDTDPLQAELLLLLTASAVREQDWTRCVPKPGSLFVVGDPKQSIYRFRRGDIQTYGQVKAIFERHGRTVTLQKNFRSTPPLLDWNNRVFGELFPAQATDMRPAFVEMQAADLAAAVDRKRLEGVFKLSLSPPGRSDLRFAAVEAEEVAKLIRVALDQKWEVQRTPQEKRRGKSHVVSPGDFLILTWGKRGIRFYRDALIAEGVASEVSGTSAFSDSTGLSLLLDCLRAIDDPNDPVPFAAVCRDRLFGIGDADLYRFKKAGGRFRYTSAIPESLDSELRDRFAAIQTRFQRYQKWLRLLPFIPACQRIAEDLGLLAASARSEQGNIDAGTMFNAIEWIRHQSQDFDSTADLIGGLEELLSAAESQGTSARTPSIDVVRVMNLHKAKGLEAPVVFLCDSGGYREPPVSAHIDRSGESDSVGYMCIRDELTAEQRKLNQKYPYQKYQPRIVAAPHDWEAREEKEKEFLSAEKERLLYVAATRGKSMTVVCQGAENAHWSPLYPFLKDVKEVSSLFEDEKWITSEPAKVESSQVGEHSGLSEAEIKERWLQIQCPSYEVQSAKSVSLKGAKPKWQSSGNFGYRWGSALHDLMDLAVRHPHTDLEMPAQRLCREYGVDPGRVSELLATAASVVKSDMWQRATLAKRSFSEIPFEVLREIGTEESGPKLLRGVIDLVFEEEDGWVIVDYKTDEVASGDVASAKTYYWPQLKTYAKQWKALTGFTVKEVGLYFTNLHQYEPEYL